MKKTLIFIAFVVFYISSFAQKDFSGGFLFGIVASQVDGDEQAGYNKAGLSAGVYVTRPFSDITSFKIETYYAGKGAVSTQELADGISTEVFKTSLHYAETAFLLDFKLSKKFDVAAGFAPSYLFSSKLTRYKIEIDENLYSLKSFDFQPVCELNFYFAKSLFAGLRFSYSLFNIREDPFAIWDNNNLTLFFQYKVK
ncbi:MAG: PorT family protein [Chlorobi bacterium]|nr:PorT family protein [Chlorobiota bacterium]